MVAPPSVGFDPTLCGPASGGDSTGVPIRAAAKLHLLARCTQQGFGPLSHEAMPTAATECQQRRNRPAAMNTHRQSGNVLRRPTTLSIMLVVLAVALSGCVSSDWFSGLPGLAP